MRKLFSKRSLKATQKTAASKTTKISFIQKLKFMTEHWNFKKITGYLVVFALIVGISTSWIWYQKMYMTPERRFYNALENSMATPSVVRTLTQGGSGNSIVQEYRFHFAPQRVIENAVSYIEKSATIDTKVETEGIIYPSEQFLRYSEYRSAGEDSIGLNLDEVLGDWANESAANSEESELNYLSEQVSLAIFGNFNGDFRREIMSAIKDKQVYGTSLSDARTETIDGEEVLVYSVSVKLKEYMTLLNKSFAQAGYGEFPPLDPANYQEDAMVNAQFMIRKRDNTITAINFGGRDERYGNYGVQKTVERPTAVRTIEELQADVQELFEKSQQSN